MKIESVNSQISPSFIVKRIKPLSFFLTEKGLPKEAVYRVDFRQTFQADVPNNMIAIEIEVLYILPNNEDDSKNMIVLHCTVQNAFEIQNLSNYIIEQQSIQLPNETIINLVSLSVSHTRAALAILSSGTLFQESLIPVINPVEMAKTMFPELTF